MRLRFTCVLMVALPLGPVASRGLADEGEEFFEARIRPLLVEKCEQCHSAARGRTRGGLALDSRSGWMKGGDSGPPLVAGKPEESLLIQAVRYADDSLQMPPRDAGGPLSAGEISVLEEWVRRGAPDPRTKAGRGSAMSPEEARTWWSFQPLRHSDPPRTAGSTWARTDIDRFVEARWAEHGLSAAPPADRRTLLRRMTLDLTGLPPTPADVAACLTDSSPEMWDHVVDRLLASPAYGQRWARHWLDVARYADYYDANPQTRTPSCEITEAWRYRDWVVQALNDDLPYDRFVALQIAGDRLAGPQGESFHPAGLIATTFLTNGVWDRGDADKEKIVSDMADDNIDTVGKVFLGLTLGCARCHDHKFDPISTEDYYALAGIFYSSHILKELGVKGGEYTMNRVPLLSPAQLQERQDRERQLAETTARLALIDSRARYAHWSLHGTRLVPGAFESTAGATGQVSEDGVVVVGGTVAKDTYTVRGVAPAEGEIRTLRLEVLPDPALPNEGPGRASDGNFVLSRVSLAYGPPGGAETPVAARLINPRADFEQTSFPAAAVLDEKPETGWGISPQTGLPHVLLLEIGPETPISAGAPLTITLEQKYADTHPIGRFRLATLTSVPTAPPATDPQRPELAARQRELQQSLAEPIPLAIAMTEGGTPGGLFPGIQDVPVHIRGSYARLGPVVPRRLPRVLAGDSQPPIAEGSGRRELAEWIASPANPLTARVMVNRVWQWHFGDGLVRTPSNFGKLGEAPTHPELLDWLASRFIADGWSLKSLHRRILLSAVYQQSSRTTREQLDRDPENRWLARFAPRRLEAEAIRDSLLAVSGQLDVRPGGPAGDDLTIDRRSLYVQTARWDRSGYATLFDAANPDSSTEKRIVSTVAPQALLLLNHNYILGQARRLAERLVREVPSDDVTRIQYAYQLLFNRPARDEELAIALPLVASAPAADPLSGWIDLAHVLLCSNEFVYLE